MRTKKITVRGALKMAIKENKAKKRYAMVRKTKDSFKLADYKVKYDPKNMQKCNAIKTLRGYRKT